MITLIKKNKISFLLLALFLMWGITAAPIQSNMLLTFPATTQSISLTKVTTCPKIAGAFNLCQLTKIQYVINHYLCFGLAYLAQTFFSFRRRLDKITCGFPNIIFKPPRSLHNITQQFIVAY